MLASLVAKRLARANIHYGWVVAAVAFLTMLATSGAVGLPGALILPLAKEFGWDVSGISSALAVRLILFGLMGPFAAALIERYGVRSVVLTAVALIAWSCSGASWSGSAPGSRRWCWVPSSRAAGSPGIAGLCWA